MPTILSSQIFKKSCTLVTRFTISSRPAGYHFSYRNVPGAGFKPIQPVKGILVRNMSSNSSMEEEEDRLQYNPLKTSKQKSVWKVVDEWPPRKLSSSSPKKKKSLPKNSSSKEEKIERMRRFLVKNDAEFQKGTGPAKHLVNEKKHDGENNSTERRKPIKTQSARDQRVKESSRDSKSVKDQEGEVGKSCKRTDGSQNGKNNNQEEFEFSVLSYNILADNLMLKHPELYRKCESAALDWNYRWEGIKREILAFQCPDIICLQEVQFHNPDHATTHIIPFLSSIGYRSIIKPKTGNKDDGCLIAFSRERFLLEETVPVNYKVERVNVLDRDNVGLILKLVPLTNHRGITIQHNPIIIANTHLLYNPKRTDIRLAQSALLLAELDRIAVQNRNTVLPIILTGDFNSEPWSPVLGLFLNKRHHYAGSRLGRKGKPAPDKLLPDSLGLSDTCQWLVSLQQRGAQQDFVTGSGAFSHNINFRSVFPPSGHVTTYQEVWTMVDYILFSSQNETLKLSRKKDLPSSKEMTVLGRIPSVQCPSDHLPLLASFCLKLGQ